MYIYIYIYAYIHISIYIYDMLWARNYLPDDLMMPLALRLAHRYVFSGACLKLGACSVYGPVILLTNHQANENCVLQSPQI